MNEYVRYGLKLPGLYHGFSAEIFASPKACGQGEGGNIQLEQMLLEYVLRCVTWSVSHGTCMSFLGVWESGTLSVVTKRICDTLAVRKQEHNTSLAISCIQ